MAGAAILRSLATKTMARAQPRLPSALEHHGRLPTSSGGLWLSRFSTSTGGSMPPVANLRGPQTDIKKVRSGSDWDRVKTAAIEATTTCAFFTVVGGVIVIYGWVNPALDRINANLEASNRLDMEIMDEIKRGHQRIREHCGSSES
ncbi:unnamed protein product [Miscanthus lutarioriparius]|uniref:Uncharacterized protein n=1 Tax=Miscanthus lutarioriparius TaxID=422564 RepID=A0A811QRQ0_9POAL|nr:unnamed protein product [Miscanthus lutarioriparius]